MSQHFSAYPAFSVASIKLQSCLFISPYGVLSRISTETDCTEDFFNFFPVSDLSQDFLNPSDISIERLQDRMPALTLFDEANESLQWSYELTQVVDGPPQALANLANVASLNLRNLLNAVQSGDQADVNTIETRANAILAERLEADWSQSGVRVVFRTVGTNLFIQIRDEEDHFSGLDERSDGLRQFVALLAFCCG